MNITYILKISINTKHSTCKSVKTNHAKFYERTMSQRIAYKTNSTCTT